ncbi:MAG: class I SAM-dependent methyltransferase [Chloroflexi bacterium]|nr:class I SAM-dependent methyltransferase [Chloroflexota bacterium]
MTNAEVKRLVIQHWERRAADFDERPNHGLHSDAQHQAWREVLGRLAGPDPLRMLDVGCGTGFLALLLAELGHQVDGIDLATEMLERARAKAAAAGLTVYFQTGDAEAPDAPDGTYDLVVERHVIWTLPDPPRAVRSWLRVLRPGGRMVLIEGSGGIRQGQEMPAEYAEIYGQLPFSTDRSSERLTAFLQDQGVVDLVVEPLMDPVLWGSANTGQRYAIIGRKPRYRDALPMRSA